MLPAHRVFLLMTFAVVALTATAVVQSRTLATGSGPGDWPCCAATTERITLKPGQDARLELKNKGDEPVAVRLQFVDQDGKVLTQKDVTVKPGADELLSYAPFGGGVQPVAILGQFGTVDAKLIGLLRPALRIVETVSGKTVRLMGPESFAKTTTEDEVGYRVDWGGGHDSVRGFTSAALTFNGQFSEARLTVRNNGSEQVVVWLRFVDKEGKVLLKRFAMVKPGEYQSLAYGPNLGGGVQPGEVRAQVGTGEKFIGLLQPGLRLVEKGSEKTIQSIGAEGFKAFNPNTQPPLK